MSLKSDIVEKLRNELESEERTTEKDFGVIRDVDNLLQLANMRIEADQSQQTTVSAGRNMFEEIQKTEERYFQFFP